MVQRQKRHLPWSDDELTASVDAYLYMLQLEQSGIRFSAEKHANLLLQNPLHKRGKVSIRYRMRNISFVMEGRGMPIVPAFSPASQVGSNVKKRIDAILDSRIAILNSIIESAKSQQTDIASTEVLDQLGELKNRVAEIERFREIGIGHNNPPGSIDLFAENFSEITKKIAGIEEIISESRADGKQIHKLSETVSGFGLKVAVWIGQRLTEFSRAAAVTLGSVLVIHGFEIQQKIVETLRLVFSYIR